jgi:hypothetical protein
MGKLKKKLVLTFNYYGLSVPEVTEKQNDVALAHENNPTIVPGLTPAPSVVLNQISALNNLFTQRDMLKAQVKQLTVQIHQDSSDITDIIMDQWRPQAQTAIGDDEGKAVLLGWGIKGYDTGHVPNDVAAAKAETTNPYIARIDVNSHEQHMLHIINNTTGKRALPKGMLRIDVYGQTGGDKPSDYLQMGRVLGQASRGKFVATFDGADVGKMQYYIAVYIDKKTKKPLHQSPVSYAIIN